MKKIFSLGLAGLAMVLLLVAAGCQNGKTGQTATSTTVEPNPGNTGTGSTANAVSATVEIKNNQFIPDTVRINVGDTVKWTNQDNYTHTISAFGVEKDIPAGAEYTQTFDQAGTYQYQSTKYPGMVGTVIVGGGQSPENTGNQPTSGNQPTGTSGSGSSNPPSSNGGY